jgi:hypothetical protein
MAEKQLAVPKHGPYPELIAAIRRYKECVFADDAIEMADYFLHLLNNPLSAQQTLESILTALSETTPKE